MSKAGQRDRDYPTTPTNSYHKDESRTIIDKPPLEEQEDDALLPDGFRRINH